MAQTFVIDGDLTLTPEEFTNIVDMRMPVALARLLSHLGSSFFVLDPATGEFFPSPEAQEICEVVERSHKVPAAELEAKTTELKKAVKAAYDAYVALMPGQAEAPFFKGLP